jgi:uncharacterized protein YkwD
MAALHDPMPSAAIAQTREHRKTLSRNLSLRSSAENQLRHLLDLERCNKRLPLLEQSSSLDHLAQMQAQFMADTSSVDTGFENVEELCEVLNCKAAGENIQSGQCHVSLHRSTMETKSDMILSPTFTEYGMGLALGKKDDKLYLCHLFRLA